MKKEIAERWVEALRSGAYGQTQQVLNDGKGNYCCLGVLCDVVKDEVKGEWHEGGDFLMEGRFSSHDVLPFQVARFVEADTNLAFWELGVIPERTKTAFGITANYLTELNDNAWTFDDIADAIEHAWINVSDED